ncbi:MAG TPA: isoprenylcysteine carboxylmethyltransferase family protein [Sphingomicrobium sp.]|nr:isoprenylcysteine carboxylmethyltransferase family protein [Sphingomicrobium sp.]
MTSEDNPRVFVPPPLIFAALLAFGLLIDSKPFVLGGMQVLALAVGLAGFVSIGLALGLFRASNTRPEPWRPASALVAGGIYRVTRNPMYLGMAMLSLAGAMFFASMPAGLLTILAMILVDRLVVEREEAYLARRFGEDYLAYRRAVRRWL